MKIHHILLFCLIATSSNNAFAGGGFGDAFAKILEILLIFAIVLGGLLGYVCGNFVRRIRWHYLAIIFVLAVVLSLMFPFVGFFLGIPFIVFIVVLAAVTYLFHESNSKESIVASESKSKEVKIEEITEEKIEEKTEEKAEEQTEEEYEYDTSIVYRWMAVTYVFWLVLSLSNSEITLFAAVPPMIFIFSESIIKFLPFLFPPLLLALSLSVFITYFFIKKSNNNQHAAPWVFNVCLLVSLLISVETYRFYLMKKSLNEHKPQNLYTSSFLSSFLTYGPNHMGAHGSFDEDGKHYHWSYAERKFVQVP